MNDSSKPTLQTDDRRLAGARVEQRPTTLRTQRSSPSHLAGETQGHWARPSGGACARAWTSTGPRALGLYDFPVPSTSERAARPWRARVSSLRNGPTLGNLVAAFSLQAALLVSGTLSARALGPESRGFLALLTAFTSTICQIGAVGISLSLTYFLASGQVSGPEIVARLRRPITQQFALILATNIVVASAYVVLSGASIEVAAAISLVAVPASLAMDYAIAIALGARDHRLANRFRPLPSIAYAVGLAVLYATNSATLTSVIATITGTAALISSACLVIALRRIGVDRADILRPTDAAELNRAPTQSTILKFGRSGYLGYLAPVDTFRLDQYIVGLLLSPRALGFYVVGGAFTNLSRVVAQYVGLSSTPEVASAGTEFQRRAVAARTLKLSAAAITIINICVAVGVTVAIPLLFGDEYRGSVEIAQLLSCAAWFSAMKRVAVDVMRGFGETRIGTTSEIINVSLFLPLGAGLGLWYGGAGVATALLISSGTAASFLALRLRARLAAPALSDASY